MRKTKYLLRFFQLLSSSFLFDSCHLASCSAYTSQKLTYALWKIPCRSQACGSLCPSCFGSTIDVCLYVCLFSSGTAAFAGPLCPILWINKYSKRKKKKKPTTTSMGFTSMASLSYRIFPSLPFPAVLVAFWRIWRVLTGVFKPNFDSFSQL